MWLIISTVLLTLPGNSFPNDDWLSKIWVDKWVHLGMFSIMVVLWCLGLNNWNPESPRKLFTWIGIMAFLYGIIMEIIQHYCIPNRAFDAGDIIADGIGSFAGWWLSCRRYIKK